MVPTTHAPSVLARNPIEYSSFCSLLSAIRAIPPRRVTSNNSSGPSKQQQLLESWIEHARTLWDPLPVGTVTLFCRLFLPEEGVRRRYNLREQALSVLLEKYFKVRPGRFDGWCQAEANQRSESCGCLGMEVERWLNEKRESVWPVKKGLKITLGEVDALLDQLASHSQWSSDDVHLASASTSLPSSPTTPLGLLKTLLDPLTPPEIAFTIQILLRDLSPLLYPLSSLSGVVALGQYNTRSYPRLERADVLRAWCGNRRLEKAYRVMTDLDVVTALVDREDWFERKEWSPVVGIQVQVPKSQRPGTTLVTTKHLTGDVAVETKYDGERLQIHIDLIKPYEKQIQIFSKSGRDSTRDRILLHPIIRAALNLDSPSSDPSLSAHAPFPSSTPCTTFFPHLISTSSSRHNPSPTKLIIEGEMVSYDESKSQIAEFWTLAAVKHGAQPHVGIGSGVGNGSGGQESLESHETGDTGEEGERGGEARGRDREEILGGGGAGMHLAIVWFDVLLVDEESLMDCPYRERRARLESLVRVIPGFSMLAESKVINFDDKEKALPELREHFAKIIVERGEGLMLKHVDSIYNGYGKNNRFARWIKLKKDFIPGAGDTMDFHVLGASWSVKRGRELMVPPSVFTTFFVGFRADHFSTNRGRQSKPHYHILFAASYGPTRDELCNLCHRMREEKHYFFTTTPEKERQETKFEARAGASGSQFAVYGSPDTEFTFSLADRLKSRYEHPAWIFEKPRVFELTGAGFQRQPGSEYYELRWPRITKTSRESGAPLSLERLQLVAERAMAVTTDAERAEHEHEELWRRHGMGSGDVSGGVEERMGKERRMWVRKLERADRVQEVKDSQEEEEREQRRTCQASSSLVESRRGLGPPLQLKTNVPTPARHGKRQPSTPSTALVERPAARPPPQQPRHSRKRSIEVLVLEGSDEDAPPPKPPTSSKLTTSPIPARHVAKSMPIIASPPRPFLPPVGPSSDAVGDEMDMISGFKRRRSDPVSSTTHPHAHKKLKRRATIAVSGDYPSLPYDLSALGPRLSISSLPPARSTTYWSYYPMISPSPSSPSSLSTATPPPAPPPPPPPNPIKSLDPTSFLLNPFDVFWAAGYTFPGSPPLLRPPTNGVIFLSSPDAWLSLKRDLEGASKEEGERGGTVMVVNRDWEFEHKLFGRHTVDFL